MAVKFHCRKCGKRYIDWGAKKLGYKCPDCEGEELVRVGMGEDRSVKRPSLKRRIRKAAPIAVDTDFYSGDIEEGTEPVVEDTELIATGGGEVETEVDYDLDAAVPADGEDIEEGDLEVADDLAFDEDVAPTPLAEDGLDEPVPDTEWPE